ncbi:MAG: hypothetical protein D4R98_03425 [Comamonadaceae bacterium]|nr:MAG: hypothetical protein D4R98_03425 [Comamonadaceae bacterium]
MNTAAQWVDRVKPEPIPKAELTVISANPLDLPAALFQEGLTRRRTNRAALMAWVRDALIDGVDFGKIHVFSKSKCPNGNACNNPAHFSKPSLFKPGAEKICGMLGVTVRYPTLKDYEQVALAGAPPSVIILRCEIVDASGGVVADGVGARSLAQDYGDLNKALKMAEKSAHIDATLRMAGLSEVFTQDIEDMQQRREAESIQAAEVQLQTHIQAKNQAQTQPANYSGISKAQHQQLEARIKALGLDRARVKDWMIKASRNQFTSFLELNTEFYQILFDKLDQFAGSVNER